MKNSLERNREFKSFTGLPLPSEAIPSRRGTWIEAVLFYCQNFEIVCQFIEAQDEEVAPVRKRKAIISKETLQQQLAFVNCAHYQTRRSEQLSLKIENSPNCTKFVVRSVDDKVQREVD